MADETLLNNLITI